MDLSQPLKGKGAKPKHTRSGEERGGQVIGSWDYLSNLRQFMGKPYPKCTKERWNDCSGK